MKVTKYLVTVVLLLFVVSCVPALQYQQAPKQVAPQEVKQPKEPDKWSEWRGLDSQEAIQELPVEVKKKGPKRKKYDYKKTLSLLKDVYGKPTLHISGFKKSGDEYIEIQRLYYDVDATHYIVVIIINGEIEYMDTLDRSASGMEEYLDPGKSTEEIIEETLTK